MADLYGFDANEVEPNVGFEPVPAGKYLVKIVESETKATKSGGGKFLSLKFQVIDGPCVNRTLFANLNLENANAQAVKIARGDLSAICRAVGVLKPRDSIELHNIPLVINVKLKNRKDTGEPTNVIKGYERKEALTKSEPSQAANSAPWRKQQANAYATSA